MNKKKKKFENFFKKSATKNMTFLFFFDPNISKVEGGWLYLFVELKSLNFNIDIGIYNSAFAILNSSSNFVLKKLRYF